ncbi:hypothetical protein STPH2_2603 [Streptomyces sp. KO7888]|nr:hypothetical protein [Streptomyces sp. KO7888]
MTGHSLGPAFLREDDLARSALESRGDPHPRGPVGDSHPALQVLRADHWHQGRGNTHFRESAPSSPSSPPSTAQPHLQSWVASWSFAKEELPRSVPTTPHPAATSALAPTPAQQTADQETGARQAGPTESPRRGLAVWPVRRIRKASATLLQAAHV